MTPVLHGVGKEHGSLSATLVHTFFNYHSFYTHPFIFVISDLTFISLPQSSLYDFIRYSIKKRLPNYDTTQASPMPWFHHI